MFKEDPAFKFKVDPLSRAEDASTSSRGGLGARWYVLSEVSGINNFDSWLSSRIGCGEKRGRSEVDEEGDEGRSFIGKNNVLA